MKPETITILGGGTAGWMAACLLNHHWPETRIRLIESSRIGIVGVGEGSTPQLKAFFDTIGVSEAEWMPAANATFKLGIRFEGWSEDPRFASYFHPFPTELDVHTTQDFFTATQLRRSGHDVPAHPDDFLLPERLAERRLGPGAAENWPFEVAYGYHFDAHRVGEVLKKVATARGVEWVDTEIAEVEIAADGTVTALVGKDGERHAADFFIDASGQRAMIMTALDAGARPFPSLKNDRAVVMATPVPDAGPENQTRAIAMQAGWRWSIPLTHRTGNGYVYSSAYRDAEDAERELRAALGVGEEVEARHLAFSCGAVAESWVSNCLAIGLAQGFLEPLEATALHIVLATVGGFVASVERGGWTGEAKRSFNSDIARRYSLIADYIHAHYRLHQRRDTPYWRDTAADDDLSDDLKHLITHWFTRRDLAQAVADLGIADGYNAASWHCLFAGYGNFPPDARLTPPRVNDHIVAMEKLDAFLDACASHYRPHDDMLAALERNA